MFASPSLIDAERWVSHVLVAIQSWESLHRWLSPPDPSTNHNIACRTHYKRKASWFFQSSIFQGWKTTGSLLWIHGKRAPCSHFPLPKFKQHILFVAGSGKSILWFAYPFIISVKVY